MNSFMNALYNAVGATVTGRKNGVDFLAYISNVRVKYGNDLCVTLSYDDESMADIGYGSDLITGSHLFEGKNSVFENLHVYF